MFSNLKSSLAPLILRWGLATIFLYHGFLKISYPDVAGWNASLPMYLQHIVAWGEIIGAVALTIGLLSRLAALWFAVSMIGAIQTVTGWRDFVHVRNILAGGRQQSDYHWDVGYEYNFAIIVMCCTLIILGSGTWSMDYRLFHRKKKCLATAPGGAAVTATEPAIGAHPDIPVGAGPSRANPAPTQLSRSTQNTNGGL